MNEKSYELIKQVLSQESVYESMKCYLKNFEQLKNCRFVFFGDKGGRIPDYLNVDTGSYTILGVTDKPRILLLDEKRLFEMNVFGKSSYQIDNCISFDTQVVSYIGRMFASKNKQYYCELYNILLEILRQKIDYDCLPYLMENSYKLQDDKIKQGVYQSLISYLQFQQYQYNDFLEYPSHIVPINNVIRDVDDLVHRMDFMANGEAKEYIDVATTIRILIAKTIQIEFEYRRKGIKYKIDKLIDFVNEELGIIQERELIVCYLYLKKGKEVSKFFKGIQKNARNILKKIEGMAWDLTHIRIMELSIQFDIDEDKPVCLRSLLTFDNGLRDILKNFPLRAIGFCNGVPVCAFEKNFIDVVDEVDLKEKIISNTAKRKVVFNNLNRKQLLETVEKDLLNSTKN
jgi:hypothetical protein